MNRIQIFALLLSFIYSYDFTGTYTVMGGDCDAYKCPATYTKDK